MIIVTGAAGFMGSRVIEKLNKEGLRDIIAVDVLRTNDKWKNLRGLDIDDYLDRDQLWDFLVSARSVEAIIHMGACSATTERNTHYLMENNYRYTLRLARWCLDNDVRFIYASSAATYGMGEQGYDDDEETLHLLRPMNMYGFSKHLFDLKARREGWFDHLAGLKFFNVYGPGEYFKGDMASVVFKAFLQIKENKQVRLFRSHHPEYRDGEQLRDFIYVKDAVDIVYFLLQNPGVNGLFNAGTGRARSFKDLVTATFKAMDLPADILYIDMPEEIRDRYQYFTEARMDRLRSAGYRDPFHELEDGIRDYVQNYLRKSF